MYFRSRKFRGDKLSRISRILAKYAKVYPREIFMTWPSAKVYPREKKLASPSAKVNPREKNVKFYKFSRLFRAGNLVLLRNAIASFF